ncbi:uncharacterized protein LOC115068822 [Nannospalax galili]|uniref:uncharacterized protein LOC115068822 n=1 Tax=Nannospalax galili TaxID=1026970 RepID=UPI00111BEC51|nr:uncharacterized protein LOC115068822 [Nannospalax galili]
MWRVVTQLPKRALVLEVHLWGLFLHLLSQGLWAPLLCLLMLLRMMYVWVQKGARVAFTAACPVGFRAQVCSIYVFLQGVAWAAQLVGSGVTVFTQLFCVLLETLTHIPLIPLCESSARWLVQAGVWASRGLAQVWGMKTFVQPCAHSLFLGMCLCMHICFAAISSKVHVRVHVPFHFSLPVRVHAPLNLGVKVRLQGRRPEGTEEGAGAPSREIGKEQRLHTSRSLQPTRRREVSRSRGALSPGG